MSPANFNMIRRLFDAVDAAAESSPDAIAFEYLDQSLSYAALAEKSDRLASVLASHGVRRGDRVALFLEKSIEAPIALFGAMKAGAAYVPIDAGSPPDRARAAMAQCGTRVVVSRPSRAEGLAAVVAAAPDATPSIDLVIGLEAPASPLPGSPDVISWPEVDATPSGPRAPVFEQDLAYIISRLAAPARQRASCTRISLAWLTRSPPERFTTCGQAIA